MLDLHHNAELQVSCFLQPPTAADDDDDDFLDFSRDNVFFHQHFRSLIDDDDDDLGLHDISGESTMTSPLLCDTAYLSVS